MNDDEVISLDADLENADWTKRAWDLPPYKSPEFLDAIGGPENLPAFRKLPVYNAAVAAGLIMDDEWLADHVSEHKPEDK